MENEENNYPVPLLDEDCKHIINQENINMDSNSNHTTSNFTKLKSQLEDKKVNYYKRESIIENINKVAELRSAIKNSPVIVKKPLHVKIEDKFALTHDSGRTSKTQLIQKQTSSSIYVNDCLASTIISPNNSSKNVFSHKNEAFLQSSSESENNSNLQKKQTKSSNSNFEINNPFIKRNKPIVHNQSLITVSNQMDVNNSQGNLPFSKLELFLEKDPSSNTKNEPDKLVIVLKIKKQIWKNKKSILIFKCRD